MPTTTDSEPDIDVFNETDLDVPVTAQSAQMAVSLLEQDELCSFQLLEIVYVDEESIVEINNKHLDRNYVTDIITFRYDEDDTLQQLEGTLYCCAPRIEDQAEEYDSTIPAEYYRILVHGLLHLIGYDDQTDSDRNTMKERENYYLQKLSGLYANERD